jgi:tricorn protease
MKGYYLYPDIHKNRICFVSDDDVWLTDDKSHTASRLTVGFGVVSRPKFSPDGAWIAFRGQKGTDQASAEIYVISTSGGEARRLTYFGGLGVDMVGWTKDGKVVFSSDTGRPFRGWKELFKVSPSGGEPERLQFGPATGVTWGEGFTVLARNSSDLTYWKRYKGGTRGKFWLDRTNSGEFVKFLELDSNLNSPCVIGRRLYFVSDHEGVGNIYSVSVDGNGGDINKHTNHNEYYVRNASSDGERIVFHSGGDLFIYDPSSDTEAELQVDIPSPQRQKEAKYVEPSEFLEAYGLHPKGHMLVLTIRGKLFVMGNWDGPVQQAGLHNGVRYRLPNLAPEGNKLVAISDSTGEERLELHDLERTEFRQIDKDFGIVEELVLSPNGEQVAVTNNRFELWSVQLSDGSAKRLDSSEYGSISGVQWHPSGEWLAYSFPESNHTASIKLVNVSTGESARVTTPTAVDYSPSFDPDGRYLYYLSQRWFDPVYDKVIFDLGFPRASKPFAVTLQKETPSPFNPVPKPPTKGGEAKDTQKTELKIDIAGIVERAEPFPVDEGDYVKIEGIKGKALFLSFPVEGAMRRWLFSAGPRTNGLLEFYDLEENSKDTLLSGISDFELSADRSTLAYRVGEQIRVVKAGEKPDEKPPNLPGRKSGWVDLKRIKVLVDPAAEWKQMLRETWRLMRENYWREDMRGLDWAKIWDRYYNLLNRISTRSELSDLLREMQGELGTSHAYEIGGDYGEDRLPQVGAIGAELKFDGNGYRIESIFVGDPSNPGEKSPLKAAGVGLEVGDVLLEVAGQRLTDQVTWRMALLNHAGDTVSIRAETKAGVKTLSIKTLQDERQLLYRAWVETNRSYVHEKTNGRIGYVHIPDMGPHGYAEFHRLYPQETERDGLIVDVRYNGGGHVSMLLLEKLARKRIAYDKPRRGKVSPYPQDSVKGPIVALTNELAGSDGDIFSHSFKLLGLGPLIGTRTWGGVIGINPRLRLVDGTFVTQPQFAFWFSDVGWGVENYGTEPTMLVENRPQDYARGIDSQLDTAIDAALQMLDKATPVNAPD